LSQHLSQSRAGDSRKGQSGRTEPSNQVSQARVLVRSLLIIGLAVGSGVPQVIAGEPLTTLRGQSEPIRQVADAVSSEDHLAKIKTMAEEGFPPAQLVMGTAYAFGQGVSQDLKLARTWFTRAAEAGNTTALYNLSLLSVLEKDFPKAYQWSWIAKHRAQGQIQGESAIHAQLFAGVIPYEDLLKAERSGQDWLEDIPEQPDANLEVDAGFAFARISSPPDGWHSLGSWWEEKGYIEGAVMNNFASSKLLERRSKVVF
jgi:hypothetical protein